MNGTEKALKERAEQKRLEREALRQKARRLRDADPELSHNQLAHRLSISGTKLYKLLRGGGGL